LQSDYNNIPSRNAHDLFRYGELPRNSVMTSIPNYQRTTASSQPRKKEPQMLRPKTTNTTVTTSKQNTTLETNFKHTKQAALIQARSGKPQTPKRPPKSYGELVEENNNLRHTHESLLKQVFAMEKKLNEEKASHQNVCSALETEKELVSRATNENKFLQEESDKLKETNAHLVRKLEDLGIDPVSFEKIEPTINPVEVVDEFKKCICDLATEVRKIQDGTDH